MPDKLKVKRDGPRGWHWIDAKRFDPAVHVLVDPPPPSAPAEPPPAKRRGRPPKSAT